MSAEDIKREVATLWFETTKVFRHRREGQTLVGNEIPADDVLKCLDRLYRQRKINLSHVRILRIWGERGIAPAEGEDRRLWDEVIAHLIWPLSIRGHIKLDKKDRDNLISPSEAVAG